MSDKDPARMLAANLAWGLNTWQFSHATMASGVIDKAAFNKDLKEAAQVNIKMKGGDRYVLTVVKVKA